jgi:hypothetical protein
MENTTANDEGRMAEIIRGRGVTIATQTDNKLFNLYNTDIQESEIEKLDSDSIQNMIDGKIDNLETLLKMINMGFELINAKDIEELLIGKKYSLHQDKKDENEKKIYCEFFRESNNDDYLICPNLIKVLEESQKIKNIDIKEVDSNDNQADILYDFIGSDITSPVSIFGICKDYTKDAFNDDSKDKLHKMVKDYALSVMALRLVHRYLWKESGVFKKKHYRSLKVYNFILEHLLTFLKHNLYQKHTKSPITEATEPEVQAELTEDIEL